MERDIPITLTPTEARAELTRYLNELDNRNHEMSAETVLAIFKANVWGVITDAKWNE